jgi:hypothetical protein
MLRLRMCSVAQTIDDQRRSVGRSRDCRKELMADGRGTQVLFHQNADIATERAKGIEVGTCTSEHRSSSEVRVAELFWTRQRNGVLLFCGQCTRRMIDQRQQQTAKAGLAQHYGILLFRKWGYTAGRPRSILCPTGSPSSGSLELIDREGLWVRR